MPVLDGWHMYMVARGETSIEGHDNDYLEKRAKKSGLVRVVVWPGYEP